MSAKDRVPPATSSHLSLQLDLFGIAERVIDFDAEIADGAFEFCVSKRQLNRSQVPRLLVDLGRFRTPHRVSAIGGAVQSGARDPGMDDPSILSCREVRVRPEAAREEILAVSRVDLRKPGLGAPSQAGPGNVGLGAT